MLSNEDEITFKVQTHTYYYERSNFWQIRMKTIHNDCSEEAQYFKLSTHVQYFTHINANKYIELNYALNLLLVQ